MKDYQESQENWLEIGTIVSAQGLKGQLKVLSSTDFPERFEQPGQRWLQSPNHSSPQPVELISGRQIPGKNLYLVRLKHINYRNQAEALKGYKLLVSSGNLPQLEDDEYHVSALINLAVYHQETGQLIGKITDVFGGVTDLLEVELTDKFLQEHAISANKNSKKKQKKKVLIPFVREIVPLVDIQNQRIEINPPKGLLELTI